MATLERAIEIAASVHAGQKDKSGAPYILHPLRLMMKMTSEASMMTAVLHDVVEDSPRNGQGDVWTLGRLRDEKFSEEVIDALDGVTDRKDKRESYEEFVERAAANAVSRQVKIADLEDNMNMLRLGQVTTMDLERLQKYHRSWRRLKAVED